ncbi:MAG TPA: LytTR family DNA-binding domain-containing protein [Candidatus Competibacteraceae bacterium]|nr:LytTR family DNA-binding domain-containing protein [Candidatus Competibacteraceae bacterium]
MIQVMVVDDEPLARERLKQLLRELPGYVLCGEAGNGQEALRLAEQLAPDIVLMDIRMPGMDGLEAANTLNRLPQPPAIIFTTAYGEHALDAFDSQPAGYLLKPIRKEQLQRSLQSACRINRAQLNNLERVRPAPSGEATAQRRTHICAKLGGRLELIPIGNVLFFRADQKYVTVRHLHGEAIIEDPLKELAGELGERFLRIHRNALVATEHLLGIERSRDGRYFALLREVKERLEVSRRHVALVKRYLKGE